MNKNLFFAAALILALVFSCRKQEAPVEQISLEPERVTVQHILIAFQGTIPEAAVSRTQEEAKALAEEIFERAKRGEDFDGLVRKFTDDQYPGIYRMSNFDIQPDPSREEYARSKMVKSFGDVSFVLAVGGIGLAEYDPQNSKYGWHIIKRIE
jgi:parvulin-like peptidyl-prolyl isomerase